jgi:hypothetical protein
MSVTREQKVSAILAYSQVGNATRNPKQVAGFEQWLRTRPEQFLGEMYRSIPIEVRQQPMRRVHA